MSDLREHKDYILKFIEDCDEIIEITNECEPIPDYRVGDTYKRYKEGKKIMTVKVAKYPKIKWVECTAGEALDAHINGWKVQANTPDEGWVTMDDGMAYHWMWTNKPMKYRKEE